MFKIKSPGEKALNILKMENPQVTHNPRPQIKFASRAVFKRLTPKHFV